MDKPRQWKTRSIFLTSTFQDMHAERDWLRDRVFPELEERLRKRFHLLEVIDLRWGVDVSREADDEARERTVLKVCLNEIERSRPFLVGLIGQRYGWQPPRGLLESAAAEMGFNEYQVGASVTDLEISFGILGHPVREHRSWFYFREPMDSTLMGDDVAARYDDRFSRDEDRTGAIEKLEGLKIRIEAALPDRVRRYRCEWNALTRRPTGLEQFGRQVLEDLWSDLDEETRAFVDATPLSPLEQSELNLSEFVETRLRFFVGRDRTIDRLVTFGQGDDAEHWAMCVTGGAGSGKSSLFARLYRLFLEEEPLILAHAAGIDTTSTRVDNMLRRWIGLLVRDLGEEDPLTSEMTPQEIGETFKRLIKAVAEDHNIVLLVDALDQIEDADPLRWLPQAWPDGVRLVCTSRPGPSADALLGRADVGHIPLPPLDRPEATEIIRAICARYHRKPPQTVITALLAKTDENDRPSYGIPLWLVLATEELNLLGADDFARADTELSHLPGEERLDEIVRRRAEEMPAGVEGLFGEMLDRAEDLHDRAWTQAFILSTAVSLTGWRESDLQHLVPEMSQQPWGPLRFAAIRRSFRGHVVQRGGEGRWDFMHQQLREIALARRHGLGIDLAEAHLIAGSYLFDLPDEDSMKQAGIMRHLILSEVPYAAGTYLANHASNRANFLPGLEALVDHIGTFDDELELKHWINRFLHERPNEHISNAKSICLLIGWEVTAGILNPLPLSSQRATLEVVTDALAQEIEGKDGGAPDVNAQSDLAKCMGRLARISETLGDSELAAETARRALGAQEDLGDFRIENLIEQHLTLGELKLFQEDLPAAKREFEAALPLSSRLTEQDSKLDENFQARSAHLSSRVHLDLASVMATSDPQESARHAQQAQEIAQSWIERRPNSTSWPHVVAAAQEKLGDACFARNQIDLAARHWESSYQSLFALSNRNPLDRELRQHVATAEMKWASGLQALGCLEEALSRYRDACSIGDALIEADPEDVSWTRQLAIGRRNAARLSTEMSRTNEAIEHFEHMRALCKGLPASTGKDDQIRSDCNIGLAQIYSATNDFQQLKRIGEGYLEHLKRIGPLESLTPFLKGEFAIVRDLLGRALFRAADFEGALTQFLAAEDACRTCVAIGGELGEKWYLNLADTLRSGADALQQLGRMDEAIDKARESLEISLSKVTDRTSDQDLALLSENLRLLGTALAERGQIDDAIDLLNRSIALQTSRLDRASNRLEATMGLARSSESLGRLLISAGKLDVAMTKFQRGVDALSEFVLDAKDGDVVYQHSTCLEGLGVCLEQLAKHGESLAVQKQVIKARTHLVALQPGNWTWTYGLMVTLFNVAELYANLGQHALAATYAADCRKLIESSINDGNIPDPALTENLEQLEIKIEATRR